MEETTKKTRVRVSFTDKIISMFDKRSTNLSTTKYNAFKKRLLNLTERWDKLVEEQKAAAKTAKRRAKNLAAYTIEELMVEIKSRSNRQF